MMMMMMMTDGTLADAPSFASAATTAATDEIIQMNIK
jgi:hypothetical protein